MKDVLQLLAAGGILIFAIFLGLAIIRKAPLGYQDEQGFHFGDHGIRKKRDGDRFVERLSSE